MDFIQVEIIALSTSPSTGGAYALVLSEVDGGRRLPIIIGAFEAQAIAFELEKIQPPRPMTHDLLRDTFEALGAEITDVVIDELRDGTFYAKVRFTHNGEEGQLDARPSDAIALAVRVEAPILVAPSVLEEAGLLSDEEGGTPEPTTPEPAAPEKRPSRAKSEEPATPLSRVERLEAQLQTAIEQEDYEKAARLRDELAKLRGEEN
ncbi:MAG TPA: bifunctional nuclease family protein [Rhodothermales bacterium]|nr:bifunctional nuclease family protein [Rhodothermales bacterium]